MGIDMSLFRRTIRAKGIDAKRTIFVPDKDGYKIVVPASVDKTIPSLSILPGEMICKITSPLEILEGTDLPTRETCSLPLSEIVPLLRGDATESVPSPRAEGTRNRVRNRVNKDKTESVPPETNGEQGEGN